MGAPSVTDGELQSVPAVTDRAAKVSTHAAVVEGEARTHVMVAVGGAIILALAVVVEDITKRITRP